MNRCKWCNKEIDYFVNSVQRRYFCTIQHTNNYYNNIAKQKRLKLRKQRICLYCHKILPLNQKKFCTIQCRNKNKKLNPKYKKWLKSYHQTKKYKLKKLIQSTKYYIKNKNIILQKNHQRYENHAQKVAELDKPIINKYYVNREKRLVRIRNNRIFSNCGNSIKEGSHWCDKCQEEMIKDIEFLQQEIEKLESELNGI